MKKIVLLLILVFSITGLQSQSKTPDKNQQSLEDAMEQVTESLLSMMDTMDFSRMFSDSFQGMHQMMDTSMLREYMGEDFDMSYGWNSSPGETGDMFEDMIKQGLQFLESMDEEEMRALMEQLDFSQMENYMQEFDMNEIDSLIQGFELNIPENYRDSIEFYKKYPVEKRKKLKRI